MRQRLGKFVLGLYLGSGAAGSAYGAANFHAILCRGHRHPRAPCEHLRQRAFKVARQMHNDHKRHPAIRGHRALGHWTQVAVGLQAALDLAARSDTRFDLLLSDLRLPDGNGWDLLRRLEAVLQPEAVGKPHGRFV